MGKKLIVSKIMLFIKHGPLYVTEQTLLQPSLGFHRTSWWCQARLSRGVFRREESAMAPSILARVYKAMSLLGYFLVYEQI